jgi:hypothetical protein
VGGVGAGMPVDARWIASRAGNGDDEGRDGTNMKGVVASTMTCVVARIARSLG